MRPCSSLLFTKHIFSLHIPFSIEFITQIGLGQYISGAIMFDETLFQSCADGTPFVDVLKKQGIVPGIKV